MNIAYVIARFNGLFMEVLGVAVIVPNSVYPGKFTNAKAVFVCDILAVVLAVCIKMGIFDAEPTSFERHAVRRSKWAAMSFLSLNILTLISLSGVGAGITLLINSVGGPGLNPDLFGRRVL